MKNNYVTAKDLKELLSEKIGLQMSIEDLDLPINITIEMNGKQYSGRANTLAIKTRFNGKDVIGLPVSIEIALMED